MGINEVIEPVQPYLTSAGIGAVTAVATHTSLSAARALGRGTTFREQMRSRANLAAAVGVGALGAVWMHDAGIDYNALIPQVLQYTGAAVIGAGAGAAARPIVNAMRTPEGVLDHLSDRAREGALRGAVAFPLGYAALEMLSKYI